MGIIILSLPLHRKESQKPKPRLSFPRGQLFCAPTADTLLTLAWPDDRARYFIIYAFSTILIAKFCVFCQLHFFPKSCIIVSEIKKERKLKCLNSLKMKSPSSSQKIIKCLQNSTLKNMFLTTFGILEQVQVANIILNFHRVWVVL